LTGIVVVEGRKQKRDTALLGALVLYPFTLIPLKNTHKSGEEKKKKGKKAVRPTCLQPDFLFGKGVVEKKRGKREDTQDLSVYPFNRDAAGERRRKKKEVRARRRPVFIFLFGGMLQKRKKEKREE